MLKKRKGTAPPPPRCYVPVFDRQIKLRKISVLNKTYKLRQVINISFKLKVTLRNMIDNEVRYVITF